MAVLRKQDNRNEKQKQKQEAKRLQIRNEKVG